MLCFSMLYYMIVLYHRIVHYVTAQHSKFGCIICRYMCMSSRAWRRCRITNYVGRISGAPIPALPPLTLARISTWAFVLYLCLLLVSSRARHLFLPRSSSTGLRGGRGFEAGFAPRSSGPGGQQLHEYAQLISSGPNGQ